MCQLSASKHVLQPHHYHSSWAPLEDTMDRIKALFEGEKEEPKKKFRLPWEKEVKPVKKGGFAGVKGMQKKMMEQLTERAKTAITGGVSGVLVLLTMYKVISSRESVLAESRKEVQRQQMERKERLALMRRKLAGPLRAAARDLDSRIREILQPPPPKDDRGNQRGGYFASHYLEDPDESINTTLYRLCRYLFWVEQLERGIHTGEVTLDDTWQIAVDVQLERVREALASTDRAVDATKPRERLYEVIDAARKRAVGNKELLDAEDAAEALARRFAKIDDLDSTDTHGGSPEPGSQPSPAPKGLYRQGSKKAAMDAFAKSPKSPGLGKKKTNGGESKTGVESDGHANGRDSPNKEAIDKFKSAAGLRRANSISHVVEELREKIAHVAETEEDARHASDEPGLRIGRYPLRLFKDTQVAIAEVFDDRRRHRRGGADLARTSSQLQDGKAGGNGDVFDTLGSSGSGELLYTEYVLKLEAALAKDEDTNDPWVRWMVPLHLQMHRYGSLQARRQRQLTASEGREVLAARVRLMRVSVALSGLLDVLRRRLDDPWFQRNTKKMRKEYSSGIYVDVVKQAAARADSEEAKTYGVFAGLRRRQLRNKRASASKAARARWLKVQRQVPVVVEEGKAWWDRTHYEKYHGFFNWETPMETLEDLAESGNKFREFVKAAPGTAKAKLCAMRDSVKEAMREPKHRTQAIATGVVVIALGARVRKAETREAMEKMRKEVDRVGAAVTKRLKSLEHTKKPNVPPNDGMIPGGVPATHIEDDHAHRLPHRKRRLAKVWGLLRKKEKKEKKEKEPPAQPPSEPAPPAPPPAPTPPTPPITPPIYADAPSIPATSAPPPAAIEKELDHIVDDDKRNDE